MDSWLFAHLRAFFAEFGYWAVVIALLLENMGIPVPGETVLLFASFLAWSENKLHLPVVIVAGICACTVGDNIGYAIGHRGGRKLLERYRHFFRIRNRTIAMGERLFAKHGAVTVFFARFIFGMRIIAGPLAGVLRMHWRKFAIFNFLGAVVWVSVISGLGYLFGGQFERLERLMGRANAIIAVAAVVLIYWTVRAYRRRMQDEAAEPE
ncbi:MAG TPA: DedA family protein [Terriglobales bacterium]|nr:DedA family protein [Terriglobales bacterium]